MRREAELSSGTVEEALRLERNLALFAGAGTGKTYSLITLCLHLLTGARRRNEPLRPAQLCLLTFTDKAAGELRHRLRQRVGTLAAAQGEALEPELRESLRQVGRSFPTPEEWRKLSDELGAATVGTFHSLCIQLLRRAPPGSGVDPAFEILDERESDALLHETCERVILDALASEDEGVKTLCREMGVLGAGRAEGLLDALVDVLTQIREEGREPSSVPITSVERAEAGFHQALAEVRSALAEVEGLSKGKGKWAEVLPQIRSVLTGLDLSGFLSSEGWPKLQQAFAGTRVAGSEDFKKALERLKYGCLGDDDPRTFGLADHYAGTVAAFRERAFRQLLHEAHGLYRSELARRTALDFTELLVRTRDLLRDQPGLRREAQARFGALLVDEFQDTNRLQLEIVLLLSERRQGAPRPFPSLGVASISALPLEPGFLCAVGDRKQSIYEFRGADVSIFEELAQKIEAEGGVRQFLQTSRRSSPALLQFFNVAFSDLMAEGPKTREFEVAYHPAQDDLRPHRAPHIPGPLVERLLQEPGENAAEDRALEADLISQRIQALLAEEAPLVVAEGGVARRAQGGDIALLFRSFSQLEVYRQALDRHGIPHRVVGGRGFYGVPEVLDAASLLSLLADPEDRLAWASVLRSPWVGLRDSALLSLWQLGKGPGELRAEDLGSEGDFLPLEQRRLARFLSVYRQLRKKRDLLPLHLVLKWAFEETGYATGVAGTSHGEQALANVGKLLELARAATSRGQGQLHGFAQELRRLCTLEPKEEQADLFDARDPHAVQLITIHRAKGLEWPVVFVPDLAAAGPGLTEAALYDRNLGLSLRVEIPLLEGASPPRRSQVREELERRKDAESRRILYVAATRARDYLVLSGQRKRRPRRSWRALLDGVVERRGLDAAGVRDVEEKGEGESAVYPSDASLKVLAPGEADKDRAYALWNRCHAPPRAPFEAAVFSVTQLQDYSRCARRYFFAHELGLLEAPAALELEPSIEELGMIDARSLGMQVHRMLERVDFGRLHRGEQAVREHLRELLDVGADAKSAELILSSAARFLSSHFAQAVAAIPPTRVFRELPFLLRLGVEGEKRIHLKGQIDLLTIDDEGVVSVVDYKLAEEPPDPFNAYGFQLDCYALAARHFAPEGAKVRAGLVFLKDERSEPRWVTSPSPQELKALERRVWKQARSLLEHADAKLWPQVTQPRCRQLRCGYQGRCYADAP